IEYAMLSAARKKYGPEKEIISKVDAEQYNIGLFEIRHVVDSVENPENEITVEDAREYMENPSESDIVEISLPMEGMGRISAQTAKQVIFQRVREAEREVILKEYKDKVGQVVSGLVIRKDKGGVYYIDLGRVEGMLTRKETLPGENLKRGDAVRAYVENVRDTSRGPEIIVSRNNPNFVIELFKLEVPEINDGIVEIKTIVRAPGERTKIAVISNDRSIDPVGACVGMKGTRVQSIVRELRGERIDIIPWTDDPRILISRALSPATVERIGVNEEDRTAMVVVNDQYLSLAIGKRGQNVRLAMKLTGWDIDIISESEYSDIKHDETERALEKSLREDKEEQEDLEDQGTQE
ncbi:MAG TPA: transcription termination/antitermination protein NusA, partial [Nitrospirae bacterium]|nr:transcription termination/antitermination protein NusA [Nitrospirota bacterium]